MSDTVTPTSAEEAAARALAAKAGLEYRAHGDVAVDPRALSALPPEECRRLRAVPLAATASGALVAVSDPSDERLTAVRAIAGAGTRFVVLTGRTLDALLQSRMFQPPGGRKAAAPAPAPAPAAAPPAPAPEPIAPAPQPPQPAPAPQPPLPPAALDASLVEAIVAALEPKLQALVPSPAPAVPPAPAAPPAPAPVRKRKAEPAEEAPPAAVADLIAQADASIAAWTTVRSGLVALSEELEESRRALREAKENLSVAHAETDQFQRRLHTLEVELDERQALVEETRMRLQDVANALDGQARRLEAPSELL